MGPNSAKKLWHPGKHCRSCFHDHGAECHLIKSSKQSETQGYACLEHNKIEKQDKDNKQNALSKLGLPMASSELGVSYRQLGSDTKLCDTPIPVIETCHILARGTRAM
jgi:hypothetical protein